MLDTMLCDCNLHAVLVDQHGAVLHYGRETETINADLRAALVVRDQGCRFPGCDRPAHWADAHHLHRWRDGGPTDIGNLVLLCRKHHRVVHQKNWHARLIKGAILEITDPTGRVRTTRPPGQSHKLIA